MKKISILGVLFLAAAFSSYAQKSTFVPEKDLMKVQKPAKEAMWPAPVRIFEKNLTGGKAASGSWKVENGELVSLKENQPIFIKKTKPQFHLIFEFTCAEEDEGYVFLRAANGKVDEAVKVKLAGKNSDKNETSIGSINDKIWDQRDKMLEPKGERWIRMYVSVEGDAMRLGDLGRTAAHYSDRRLNKIEFKKIADKTGLTIPQDGDIGFVSTKGTLKLRKIYMTEF